MDVATVSDVKKALGKVIDPEVGVDVVSDGLIKDVKVKDGHATIRMTVTSPSARWSTT